MYDTYLKEHHVVNAPSYSSLKPKAPRWILSREMMSGGAGEGNRTLV